MASTPANATNLTQDQLVKFLIQKLEYNVPIARFWNFMPTIGGKLRIERTNQFASADIDTMATILGDGTDVTTTTADDDESDTFTCGELAARYKVDYNAQDRFKYQSIDAVEALCACTRLTLMYFRKLDLDQAGSPVSGDFRSLYDIANASPSSGQVVDMASAAPTLAKLQEAWHLCFAGSSGPNVVMCNRRASRAIIKAYNDAGLIPETIEMDVPDPLTGGMKRGRFNTINGTPIVINDLVKTDGSNLTRIYFIVSGFCPDKQIYGATGIVPAGLDKTLFIRRESAEPSGSTTTRMNVTYTFPVATAVGTYSAVSVLKNVVV